MQSTDNFHRSDSDGDSIHRSSDARHTTSSPPTSIPTADSSYRRPIVPPTNFSFTEIPVVPTPSDLANWAPSQQLPARDHVNVAWLPDFISAGPNYPTSFNISQVQGEMEQSINALLSEKVFEELMDDPLGRHRFREYLVLTRGDIASFDFWVDLRAFSRATGKVKTTALALHDLYAGGSRPPTGSLSSELREDVDCALRQGMIVGDSLDLPKQHLLQSLYATEFQAFIKHKLIEESQVRLGLTGLTSEEKHGLGEAFCLTNPRLRDHPIVLVSDGFTKLTGYSAKFIVGRNCRMLAGPATSESASKRIRRALDRGEGINTLILNYRRNGTPFWNLLCIIPLRSKNGEPTYFIGGQTEVTGTLSSARGLAFLVGSDRDPTLTIEPDDEYSPSLKAYQAGLFASQGAPPSSLLGVARTRTTSKPAAGQATRQRTREFSRKRVPENKGFSSFLQHAIGLKRAESPYTYDDGEEQQIGGAEALYSNTLAPVDIQISKFADVYQKIVIFRRQSREIIFATRVFLDFYGTPTRSPAEVVKSPLLHVDLLALIVAPVDGDYKRVRKQLKDAISNGRSLSINVGVRTSTAKWKLGGDQAMVKYCALHITPLKDGEGVAEAFAAIFS